MNITNFDVRAFILYTSPFTIVIIHFIRKWTAVVYHKSQLRAENGPFELRAILKVVK